MYEDIWADFEASLPKPTISNERYNEFICKCGGTKVFGCENLPTCTSCGIVDSMYLDDSPEWTSGVSEDGVSNDPSRCGNMIADQDLFSSTWGVGTVIQANRGSSYAMKRMARINFHSAMNHKDRALFHAYQDIERAALTVLELPQEVVKSAKVLYKKFNSEILTRGAIRTGIKANCVLYACKIANVPRTTREIADAFSIPTKDISRTSNMIKSVILGEQKENTQPSKVTRPADVIGRLLNEFGFIDGKTRMKCIKICKSLENCVPLMSKTPNSIASAVILHILGESTSRSEVCSKCNISAPTLVKIENIVKQHIS
ncbi:transcription initiation factor IIB family protein [bacterium]|nr:transcription initiation factor IIB family protein [bacterium]